MKKKSLALFMSALLLAFCFSSCTASKQQKTEQISSVAMGSVVTMKAVRASKTEVTPLLHAAMQDITQLDSAVLSKNLEGAELYRLNHAEKKQNLKVSDSLFSALSKTKEIYAHSQGMAALSSGALTEAWGMDTEAFRVPTTAEIQKALPLCADALVSLHEDQTVSFENGQILNLGSVGKGMACDVAASALQPALQKGQINSVVVSVGGSLALLNAENAKPFRIGIRDPFGDANSYFATLSLKNTFLSTSGSYEKKFEQDGKAYHHLLDLTTGYPKETDLLSVTIVAQSGLLSDALSTLCFLIGEEASLPILKEYNAQAIFVYQNRLVHMTDGLVPVFELKNPQNSSFQVEAKS